MSPYAHITGWGMAVPERVLTNQDLEKMVDTSDEWIVTRTGIRERRIVSDGETTASLATKASLKALDVANIAPAEVDLIIVSTSSPEYLFPATASLVQDNLGANKAGAFDILAACTGFIYALNIASQAIRSGSIKNAIVIGSETLSRIVDWNDRATCVLFGDGAGAFVLQAGEEESGLLSAVMRSDGSGMDLLCLPVQSTLEVVRKANLTLDDINLVIPHQANKRIIETAVRNLNIPIERCAINIDRFGNTSTASIPIATCEAIAEGRLNPGDNVVFVGFGAGLTWGAAAVKWGGPFPGFRVVRPPAFRFYARLRSFVKRVLRKIDAVIWGSLESRK
jgi:3-oxoacyl-[acyl-carrier-protein] synthase-3